VLLTTWRQAARKAAAMPSALNNFLTKRLKRLGSWLKAMMEHARMGALCRPLT